jgi:RsiW-degrading membrane proteinase PrsW (M82 family)
MAIARLFGLIVLTVISFGIGSGNNSIAAVFLVVFFLSAPALYFLPTIEAKLNNNSNSMSVFLVNFFLGWTLIGWVVALAWAHKKPEISPSSVVHTVPSSMSKTVQSNDEKICPYCAEKVKAAAIKCRHCGSELTTS